ncbi:hypothetical protein DOY81_009692 [Sarcophaga bullata]|nr:hypothetical protein DOY81_009692 [Sarcophaga bullata]
MFPYYKGPEHNVLDYDDTLAMYNAYLNKKLDDDVEEELNPDDDYESMESSTEQEEVTEVNNSHNPNPRDHIKKEKFPEYTTSSVEYGDVQRSYLSPIPNICEGKFDAVCYFNNSMHIFKGEYVWQLSRNYRVVLGYPRKLTDIFQELSSYNVNHVDACYERYDKTLLLFSGSNIWFYKENKLLENSSMTLQEFLGNTMDRKRINAALLWPKNNRTYIFADTIFWRYNDELQALDEGYPKTMIRWPGIPDNIDAAATLPNGKTYFFKDNLYWLYNNLRVHPERGYPRRASNAWLGCITRTTQTPFRSNNTTVSFISVSPSTLSSLSTASSSSLRSSPAPVQTQNPF